LVKLKALIEQAISSKAIVDAVAPVTPVQAVAFSSSVASSTPTAAPLTPAKVMESSERFDPAYPRTLSPLENGLPNVVGARETTAAPPEHTWDEELYVSDARPSSWPPRSSRKRSISEVTDPEERSARRKYMSTAKSFPFSN
jgi:hypothetical protein